MDSFQIGENLRRFRRGLERHFLETHGQKPKAWLAEQRQKQAFELLCDGSTIVKETAAVLGCRYTEHFSRDFKAYWGYSPTGRCNRCEYAGTCSNYSGLAR